MSEPASNPGTVFSFVNLRPINRTTENSASSDKANPLSFASYRFFNSIDSGDLSEIETTEPLLYTQLLADLDDASEDKRAVMQATVAAWRETSDFYYDNFEALNEAYPELMKLLDLLIENEFNYTATTFATAIESEILPTTITDYLEGEDYLENKLRLWDNLFAEVVLPLNIHLRENLSY